MGNGMTTEIQCLLSLTESNSDDRKREKNLVTVASIVPGPGSFRWDSKKKRLTDTASQSELLNWQNGKSIALYANSTFLHITSA